MAAIDHPQLSHAAAFTDLAYASRPRSHCWKSSESSTISKKSKASSTVSPGFCSAYMIASSTVIVISPMLMRQPATRSTPQHHRADNERSCPLLEIAVPSLRTSFSPACERWGKADQRLGPGSAVVASWVVGLSRRPCLPHRDLTHQSNFKKARRSCGE